MPAPTFEEAVPQLGATFEGYRDGLLRGQLGALALGIGAQISLSHQGRELTAYAKQKEGRYNLFRLRRQEADEEHWEMGAVLSEHFKRGEFEGDLRCSAGPRPVR
jgi:hypothetical protein